VNRERSCERSYRFRPATEKRGKQGGGWELVKEDKYRKVSKYSRSTRSKGEKVKEKAHMKPSPGGKRPPSPFEEKKKKKDTKCGRKDRRRVHQNAAAIPNGKRNRALPEKTPNIWEESTKKELGEKKN